MQQFRVSAIGQLVFSRRRELSHINIVIGEFKPVPTHRGKILAIAVNGRVEAGHVQLFGLGCQRFECQRLEWAYVGYNPEGRGQQSRTDAWFLISSSPA